jgi:acyl carrier protein
MMEHQAAYQSRYIQVMDFIRSKLNHIATMPDASDFANLKIDDTGIDSLELTEMIMELEEEFELVIDDSQLTGGTSISELADHIASHMEVNNGC